MHHDNECYGKERKTAPATPCLCREKEGLNLPFNETPMLVGGILLILLGAFIWGYAFFRSRIDEGIKNNRLVTDGIYAWCRNPLYTGWMIICIGISFFAGNLWLLILPFIFWALMTVMMKLTEEKWLRNLYGAEYETYCRRVNRVWPWFPKQQQIETRLERPQKMGSCQTRTRFSDPK